MVRTLKFKLLTQSTIFQMETEARTLGELKAEIKGDESLRAKFGVPSNSDLSELNFIEHGSKRSYTLTEASLPEGNTLFYVSFQKSKAGSGMERPDVESMGYNELRSWGSQLNRNPNVAASIDLSGTAEDIRRRLTDFYNSLNPTVEVEADVEPLRNKLSQAIGLLKEVAEIVRQGDVIQGGVVILSREEVEREATEIFRELQMTGRS